MPAVINDQQTFCLTLNYFGSVQGVGMRPFLYRLADELHLKGKIFNHYRGVTADLEGTKAALKNFQDRVLEFAVKPIVITEHSSEWQNLKGYVDLQIVSQTAVTTTVRHTIQPDSATCQKCWSDFFDSQSRFFNYPFVTCCDCGPRWTILEQFPFERQNTTYADFALCADCNFEYKNSKSRRHHAQTLSCPQCGPQIAILTQHKDQASLADVKMLIAAGGIGLIKGLGGFQLIGDAENLRAIERIRKLKSRPSQSLAIMVKDKDTFFSMGGSLKDWQKLADSASPIISLKNISHPRAKMLAPDLSELGVMAPTTPLHWMLFDDKITTLIITSGNPKGCALPRSINEIKFTLGSEIDFILDHNRKIVRAIDDSVLRGDLILRKGRGLTPMVHKLSSSSVRKDDFPEINLKNLALGADLKNAIALQLGEEIIEFPYAGDLLKQELLEVQSHYINNYLSLFSLNELDINSSAVDFHPETATKCLSSGSQIPVPHHFAHAWAAYSECPSDLVLTFDGTGYDEKFEMGGSEGYILHNKSWRRLLHLKPIKCVGGDSIVVEPWKSLVLFFAAMGTSAEALHSCFVEIPKEFIDVFYAYAVNSDGPMTTSMGRWFDAAAALIDFGGRKQSYEAQAPLRLEHMARPYESHFNITKFLNHTKENEFSVVEVDGAILLMELYKLKCADQIASEYLAFIAHDLMAKSVAHGCQMLGVKTVTGAGGVFQNELFSTLLEKHLKSLGMVLKLPKKIPVNDQSIAIGQLYHLQSQYA